MATFRRDTFIIIFAVATLFAGLMVACGGGGVDVPPPPGYLPDPPYLVFSAFDGTNRNLYAWSGSEDPVLVAGINESSSAMPGDLAVLGGTVLFAAADSTGDRELWSLDLRDGARLIKNINPTGSSNPRYLTSDGTRVYFQADDGLTGRELWVSDGTAGGTTLVQDIFPGEVTFSSNPRDFVPFHGRVYFKAEEDGSGNDFLWAVAGNGPAWMVTTPQYPGGIAEPSTPVASSSPDILLFRAFDPVSGTQVMAYDGTNATLIVVNDDNGDSNDNAFAKFFAGYNGKVFFQADDAIHGAELWVTDGTVPGTALYADIYPGGAFSSGSPAEMTSFNGGLYFSAQDTFDDTELFSFSGTSPPVKVVDIHPSLSSYPEDFIVFKDLLCFRANDGTRGPELWCTDGTAAGTTLALEGLAGSPGSEPRDMVVLAAP